MDVGQAGNNRGKFPPLQLISVSICSVPIPPVLFQPLFYYCFTTQVHPPIALWGIINNFVQFSKVGQLPKSWCLKPILDWASKMPNSTYNRDWYELFHSWQLEWKCSVKISTCLHIGIQFFFSKGFVENSVFSGLY